MRKSIIVVLAFSFTLGLVAGDAWFDQLIKLKEAAQAGPQARKQAVPFPDFGQGHYTITAWVKTSQNGTLFSKTAPRGDWVRNGKTLFLRGGRVAFDVGWVGAVEGRTRVTDNQWHHVAFTGGHPQKIYVDGRLDAEGRLEKAADVPDNVFKIGWTSTGFPRGDNFFKGLLDDVRVYNRVLSDAAIRRMAASEGAAPAGGLIAHWAFDGNARDGSGSLNHAIPEKSVPFAAGRSGIAMSFTGGQHLVVHCGGTRADASLWARLMADHSDADSVAAMTMERADGIWGADWKTIGYDEVARRYAQAAQSPPAVARKIKALAQAADHADDIGPIRSLYHQSKRYEELLEKVSGFQLGKLRTMVNTLYRDPAVMGQLSAALERLENKAVEWADAPPDREALDAWKRQAALLRHRVVVADNPLLDFDKLLFVKRYTYNSNHYYTEFINASWRPGGNICILSLKDGSVTELVPQLEGGVFGRFDLSYDARKVVFAWKRAHPEGYRIYEINIDGTGLKQLTFPQDDEAELVKKYRVYAHYHHGTDDMHPCYLPDGGIAFISTRCQYGILCDGPDDFTTTVIYRMNADGSGMTRLTNSSVSEASPAVLDDGRIMYTRWEYVDKGAVSVKCLWAMHPDGSRSEEIYANDISLPPTFIYGRPIPSTRHGYVVLGTPHYPQNGMGTVIRLDMNKDIRTRDPMTYMTPYVDIRSEGGFHQKDEDGRWKRTNTAPLFKDPYPLSEKFFLVSHKKEGVDWRDPKGFALYLLDEGGGVYPMYEDPDIACFLPYPLKARKKPPVIESSLDRDLAAREAATCVVTDVYHGLEDVPRGAIKYIRVLEQVPRPWAARRRWGGDCVDQQHATVTKGTHLGLKLQHGVVPVADDGSAYFKVPALKNIFFQVLDENYMALQTERTYVNYMPGETRSCIGCHETPKSGPMHVIRTMPKALKRPPSMPGPQPGEASGRRPLGYAQDVQPVLDKHCVRCHGDEKPKAGLNLSGTLTAMFSRSYESLLNRKYLPFVGENHPKTGNVHYMPARSFGSHNSLLVAMLSKGKVTLQDARQQKRAEALAEKHKDLKLAPAELLKITNWVDTNGQYYGTYWGRKNLRYKDHPNFRPVPTFETAGRMTCPIPEEKR